MGSGTQSRKQNKTYSISHLTMYDRPFDPCLKVVCVKKDGSDLQWISIPNPDYQPTKYRDYQDSLEHYMRGNNMNQGVKKPVEPTPPYAPKTAEEYKEILIKYKVSDSPPDIGGNSNGQRFRDAASTDKGQSNGKRSSALKTGSAAAISGMAAVNSGLTGSTQNPTAEMIYAKKIYGIEYSDFTDEKFKAKARVDLGIDNKSKLIPLKERKNNFKLFKKNHFADGMAENNSGTEPAPGTKAYTEIEKYALSDYGAIMIKRILNGPKKPKFTIGVSDVDSVKAHGQFGDNFILLPVNFPPVTQFAVSKQEILAVAILHHEFEHTQHGKYPNVDLNRSIFEEWRAVRYNENPVRIINGMEPRYIYYQNESGKTINIISKEIKSGKWMYDKKDPSKPLVKIQ